MNFKSTVQILVGVVLVIQLTGCIFVDRNRHGHHLHQKHDHDPSIDIKLKV